MSGRPSAKTVVTVAVSLFAALTLTGFLVSVQPSWFFDLTDTAGEPVRNVEFPGALETLLLVTLLAGFFTAAFFWLRTTPRFSLVAVVIAVVGVQAAAYTTYEMWEYHESPEFCVRTCHVMEPTYMTFAEPGVNQVMHSHQTNGTAECLDCHTGPGVTGQFDLMLTSARHIWKYTITHDYDPDNLGGDNGVLTVPDKNCEKCHGDDKVASLPDKHDRFETDCAMCHSPHLTDSSGYFFPDIILEKDDCSYCHEERPLAADNVTPTAHTVIADDDCRTCHQTHGLKDVKNVLACTDAGCHDDDAANEASLIALKHFGADPEDCADCHGGAHNLTGPTLDLLKDHCLDCHKDGNPLSENNVHLAVDGPKDGDCSSCHGAEPAPWNPDPGVASHGNLRCLEECHTADNTIEAPVPSTTVVVQSQRDWQRQNHAEYAQWNQTGRGTHDPDLSCDTCHQPHGVDHPVYPDDGGECDDTCHSWLQQDIDVQGFPNQSGANTRYTGSIEPHELLSEGPHAPLYKEYGCTGLCHNPATTMDDATAAAGGTDPGLPPGDVHGYINECTECHLFQSPAGGPSDLHSTHVPFVTAEKQTGSDTSGAFADACAYCHSTGQPGDQHTGLGGGCYNCHLSGHRPETYYWELSGA